MTGNIQVVPTVPKSSAWPVLKKAVRAFRDNFVVNLEDNFDGQSLPSLNVPLGLY